MTRATMVVERRRQHDQNDTDDVYAKMSAAKRLSLMWRLALDAWAFSGHDEPQPRLSRRAVVLQRRTR